MNFSNRKDLVFLILAGFFVTNTIVAELIGGKLVQFFGLFTQSLGIILWPVVFVLTDLINEHYGKQGVRKLTFITVGLIIYTFLLLSAGIKLPAVNFSPVDDATFKTVFGQSQWIIVGIRFLDVSKAHGQTHDMVARNRQYSRKSVGRYICCSIYCICCSRKMGF